ncbi:MAG: M20 aminoacylase family protein [Saezia sp.]
MKIIEEILANTPVFVDMRRRLHARPELSFQEHETSEMVAKMLQEWGIEVHRGLAQTGVVGVLKNGTSSKAIGLRADMDALPIHEQNNFSHASCHAGKMHACGHDGHVVMLLAAAQHLAAHKNFDGTVYFVFQPAEEKGAGGRVMVDEGLFEQFPMDAIFGMHNWPDLPVGTMAVAPGAVMASCSDFTLRIEGKGGHAALPHLSIDPLPLACQIVLGWQTIISRESTPAERSVLSVTCIHAGQAQNAIPQSCELKGTVRTFSKLSTDRIENRMHEMAQHMSAAYQAHCTFDFERTYMATVNSAQEAEFAKQTMLEVLPKEDVLTQEPSMASEDFGFMLNAKAGAYVFIGQGAVKAEDHEGKAMPSCALHNALYDFNDNIISLGATYWVRLAERFLNK